MPKDYTRLTFTTFTAHVDFTLTVGATCGSAQFIEWSLPGKSYSNTVLGETVIDAIGPVKDTVSLINGNKDGLSFCGERIFTITDEDAVSSFLSIDSKE